MVIWYVMERVLNLVSDIFVRCNCKNLVKGITLGDVDWRHLDGVWHGLVNHARDRLRLESLFT
jgi:hypothetical protein